jgi:hypothetical protein
MLVDASKFPGPTLFQGICLILLALFFFLMYLHDKKLEREHKQRMRKLEEERKRIIEYINMMGWLRDTTHAWEYDNETGRFICRKCDPAHFSR